MNWRETLVIPDDVDISPEAEDLIRKCVPPVAPTVAQTAAVH